MSNAEKEFFGTISRLTEQQKRSVLLLSYILSDRKELVDGFTLEEITYTIKMLEKFEAESNGEYNCKNEIEWLQAVKAERENPKN